jgi:heme-degrading monooxygenase HmoA
MLVKIIVVEVVDAAAYDRAQRAWSVLGGTPGFIGQTGGWTHNQRAVLVAFWESDAAHDAFMKGGHDALEREYLGSHRAIDVILAHERIPLRGNASLLAAARDATYLRIMDCRVEAGRVDRFVTVQREILTPAMESAPGLLGGAFAAVTDDPQRFVVVSLWSDQAAHDRYQSERFPAAYTAAGVTTETMRIAGQYAQVVPEWCVTKRG